MWGVGCVVLLATLAAPVSAQVGPPEPPDMNIAWDRCGAGGASFKSFACDSNTGSEAIVVSFVPLQSRSDFGAIDADLYIETSGGEALPSWWYVGSSGCRSGALAVSYDRGEDAACAQVTSAGQVLGWGYYPEWAGPNTARLIVEVGPGAPGVPVTAGVEYFGFRVILNHMKSTGVDSCGGCSARVAIRLGPVVVTYVDGGLQDVLTSPIRQDTIALQSGLVPAKVPTWGQIKALYR